MSKFDNEEFKSVIRRGHAPYEPVPENIKEGGLEEHVKARRKIDLQRFHSQHRHERLIEKYSHKRFYRFLLTHVGQLYDPGFGETNEGIQPELFNSRASFLLRQRLLQNSFGLYQVEYSILNNYAFSHYSLNNGMNFKKCKEVELRGSPAETIKSLAELISETELFLRKTIKEKNPPYLMNMK
jgi:hypothetical protein